jgi:23S rRNA (adenine-N6)-dimethyltransferase
MPRPRASTLWRTQNFLSDPHLIAHLVAQAKIGPDDVVYDLGAGTGNLTAALARRARRVVAIEKDPRLVRILRRRFAAAPNVVVYEADILRCPLPRADYLVLANPPFDITADLLRALTDAPTPPRDAYLVLQRDAAQRFVGRPRMTLAALLLAPWFAISVLHRFDRSDLAPAPSVDAVFVRLHKRGPPLVSRAQARLYRDFVTAGFSTRRATAFAALSRYLGARGANFLFRAAALDRDATPSEVPAESWLRLFRAFQSAPPAVRRRVAGASAALARRQHRLQKEHRTRVPRDGLGHTSDASDLRELVRAARKIVDLIEV